ncbi:hypothetical protein [Actinoalloteichus hymeniacidonis]|uniref:Uncharacterized protein n=1 Tax=Actinoalloteichus hymeniacidonis TaxID=340345 RepID=A0AAC9HQT9_9PSEU|nr:hypothetical protein [Actinoalloteichus hymeniacidonis]AOS63877.1 hypothetical protein TL08_15340 [Actinoalloteichus hymeniacidonis]MBB5908067.1 hypothetical protein [Actinoalloteichus hymeniacidonis]
MLVDAGGGQHFLAHSSVVIDAERLRLSALDRSRISGTHDDRFVGAQLIVEWVPVVMVEFCKRFPRLGTLRCAGKASPALHRRGEAVVIASLAVGLQTMTSCFADQTCGDGRIESFDDNASTAFVEAGRSA